MRTDRKKPAHRQIDAAISHFYSGDIECAITLAAAAEGMLPATDEPHLFAQLEDCLPEKRKDPGFLNFNLAAWRLTHSSAPELVEIVEIDEYEAVLLIARSITKFIAVYHQSTRNFQCFLAWAHRAGHLPAFK